ncbi:MAG: hypothetical protein AB8F94_20895 [Saprospiraceae bacterium]
MEIIAYLVLSFCFLMFLYFGYRDDFRRDQKKNITTVFGVLMIGSIYMILSQIELKLPLWILLSILLFFVLTNIFFLKSKITEDENNADK